MYYEVLLADHLHVAANRFKEVLDRKKMDANVAQVDDLTGRMYAMASGVSDLKVFKNSLVTAPDGITISHAQSIWERPNDKQLLVVEQTSWNVDEPHVAELLEHGEVTADALSEVLKLGLPDVQPFQPPDITLGIALMDRDQIDAPLLKRQDNTRLRFIWNDAGPNPVIRAKSQKQYQTFNQNGRRATIPLVDFMHIRAAINARAKGN